MRCWALSRLGGRFGYFLIFLGLGEGKASRESPRRQEGGGGRFFIENPRRGEGSSRRGGRADGAWRVSVGNFGGGGGLNIFFRRQNFHKEEFELLI